MLSLAADAARSLATERWPGRHAAWLVAVLAAVYVFPFFPQIHNPNEEVRVFLTRAIVEHGTIQLNPVEAEWGYVNDKARVDDRTYAGKAPGASLLGVPVLWVQTRLWHLFGSPSPSKRAAIHGLRLGAVVLPLAVFLWFFARHVERRTGSPSARDLLVLGVGLGTIIYPNVVQFVGHALAALCAFGAYLMLAERRDGADHADARMLAAAGFAAGFAVVCEYQVLVAAAGLTAYAVAVHRRRAAWFLAGALVPAAILGAYHTYAFGKPWDFPYGHIESAYYAVNHKAGFYGFQPGKFFQPRVLFLILFSNSFGLFAFSPFLLAGVVGAIRMLRGPRRADGVLALGVFVSMVLFQTGMTYWRGGWSVGPRFITTVAPFLAAAAADTLRRGGAPALLTAGFVAGSVFMCGLAGAIYPHFPEAFDNPIFDLAIPLVEAGYAPYNLGHALGVPGPWGLLPLALAVTIVLGRAVAGDAPGVPRRGSRLLAAWITCGLFLAYAGALARGIDKEERDATRAVRMSWDPPRPKDGKP